jgi:aspartyl-tRNA(Asn)/glutamyl-tRNA(Gln) amidotransferase subunit A
MAFETLSSLDYMTLSAAELGRGVAGGRLSPVQLVEQATELAKQSEPYVNAYVRFLENYANTIASEREAEVRRGRIRGPLHGIPIAIKDNFYLNGFPVTRGSRTAECYTATFDSPMVERVVAAGAVIIGKTTMPEFGWKGTGISPLTGVTRNPWNPSRNTGGSSAGSAATVAAGAVPIALGSDAGGSIRIPASFCGIVGLKPTLGRIPVWPGTVTETLSHVGPLCRFVEDARLLLNAAAGPDARDPLSFGAGPRSADDRQRRLENGTCRVGLMDDPFDYPINLGVAEVYRTAIEKVRSSFKAEFNPLSFDQPLPRSIFEGLWVTGRGLGFGNTFQRHGAIMDQGLVRLEQLAAHYQVADLFKVADARRKFVAASFELLERVDILVTPTMPITAFDADAEVPEGGEAAAPLPWVTWTPFTYPFNLSGQPAISIPCGITAERLPVGLQVVGAWGQDEFVLNVAARIESALNFSKRFVNPALQ